MGFVLIRNGAARAAPLITGLDSGTPIIIGLGVNNRWALSCRTLKKAGRPAALTYGSRATVLRRDELASKMKQRRSEPGLIEVSTSAIKRRWM